MITANQRHAMLLIEKYTGHRYTGEDWDFEQARDFISRYIEETITISQKPTDKQIKFANDICKRKHIKHNCKTKLDYMLFIQEHTEGYIR